MKHTRKHTIIKNRPQESFIATYLREIVYGASDGIVTTFAVISGFTGANIAGSLTGLTLSTVVLFGLANLFADAMSMGLGDYMSLRSQDDLYDMTYDKELQHLTHRTKSFEKRLKTRLELRGFTPDDAKEIVGLFRRNPQFGIEWLMSEYHGLPDPGATRPIFSALATFLSFLTFGIIPLLPFISGAFDPVQSFQISVSGVIVSLVLIGLLRWKVVGYGLLRALLETLAIGSVSALVAFGVGVLFG
jgi:VIT1/CCC1 family predicted Fe2+/Mn2+ transporter